MDPHLFSHPAMRLIQIRNKSRIVTGTLNGHCCLDLQCIIKLEKLGLLGVSVEMKMLICVENRILTRIGWKDFALSINYRNIISYTHQK